MSAGRAASDLLPSFVIQRRSIAASTSKSYSAPKEIAPQPSASRSLEMIHAGASLPWTAASLSTSRRRPQNSVVSTMGSCAAPATSPSARRPGHQFSRSVLRPNPPRRPGEHRQASHQGGANDVFHLGRKGGARNYAHKIVHPEVQPQRVCPPSTYDQTLCAGMSRPSRSARPKSATVYYSSAESRRQIWEVSRPPRESQYSRHLVLRAQQRSRPPGRLPRRRPDRPGQPPGDHPGRHHQTETAREQRRLQRDQGLRRQSKLV